MCWLDLADAYGSVHHSLIKCSIHNYHAPPQFCHIIQSLYSDLCERVVTNDWSTTTIPLELGVYQGDPFAVVIFNTVINTMVDTFGGTISGMMQFSKKLSKSFNPSFNSPTTRLTADFSDEYEFPTHIVPTDLCLDIVWGDDQQKSLMHAELTISYETNFEVAAKRKEDKYEKLLTGACNAGYKLNSSPWKLAPDEKR